MRKNKTWEITLTDNGRLVANEPIENAVFYTTDTEAYLNFRVTDSGFEFDSATIVMLNKDDGSIVERPMVKEDDTAVYKMESDVISHFGLWKAQVLFKQGNETFTSTPVTFEVKRYLIDERPPRLEDVQNVALLVAQANEIMQELETSMSNMDFDAYDNHIANNVIHVTQANKNTWNAKQNALTQVEKEDFKRYTVVANDGAKQQLSLEVVGGQPRIKIEEG